MSTACARACVCMRTTLSQSFSGSSIYLSVQWIKRRVRCVAFAHSRSFGRDLEWSDRHSGAIAAFLIVSQLALGHHIIYISRAALQFHLNWSKVSWVLLLRFRFRLGDLFIELLRDWIIVSLLIALVSSKTVIASAKFTSTACATSFASTDRRCGDPIHW